MHNSERRCCLATSTWELHLHLCPARCAPARAMWSDRKGMVKSGAPPPSVKLLKEGTMGAMCMLAARMVCKSACICPGEVSAIVLWNCDKRSDDIAKVSNSALGASGMLPMAA